MVQKEKLPLQRVPRGELALRVAQRHLPDQLRSLQSSGSDENGPEEKGTRRTSFDCKSHSPVVGLRNVRFGSCNEKLLFAVIFRFKRNTQL